MKNKPTKEELKKAIEAKKKVIESKKLIKK